MEILRDQWVDLEWVDAKAIPRARWVAPEPDMGGAILPDLKADLEPEKEINCLIDSKKRRAIRPAFFILEERTNFGSRLR